MQREASCEGSEEFEYSVSGSHCLAPNLLDAASLGGSASSVSRSARRRVCSRALLLTAPFSSVFLATTATKQVRMPAARSAAREDLTLPVILLSYRDASPSQRTSPCASLLENANGASYGVSLPTPSVFSQTTSAGRLAVSPHHPSARSFWEEGLHLAFTSCETRRKGFSRHTALGTLVALEQFVDSRLASSSALRVSNSASSVSISYRASLDDMRDGAQVSNQDCSALRVSSSAPTSSSVKSTPRAAASTQVWLLELPFLALAYTARLRASSLPVRCASPRLSPSDTTVSQAARVTPRRRRLLRSLPTCLPLCSVPSASHASAACVCGAPIFARSLISAPTASTTPNYAYCVDVRACYANARASVLAHAAVGSAHKSGRPQRTLFYSRRELFSASPPAALPFVERAVSLHYSPHSMPEVSPRAMPCRRPRAAAAAFCPRARGPHPFSVGPLRISASVLRSSVFPARAQVSSALGVRCPGLLVDYARGLGLCIFRTPPRANFAVQHTVPVQRRHSCASLPWFFPEDSDGEDSDEDSDIFDWDSFKSPIDGLSAADRLGEEYEAEAALAHKLSEYDLAICRAFSFKVQTNLTDRAFKMLPD
ncbi:hypothetical protein K438DRAFT_1967450 [Mycena galopus ATCC 62051]|nr:hypothetical protein K438DRAFT_1967450 [Mycena galopus ATCC 62051]